MHKKLIRNKKNLFSKFSYYLLYYLLPLFFNSIKEVFKRRYALILIMFLDIATILGAFFFWHLYKQVILNYISELLYLIAQSNPTLENLEAGTLPMYNIMPYKTRIIIGVFVFIFILYIITIVFQSIAWWLSVKTEKSKFFTYLKKFSAVSGMYFVAIAVILSFLILISKNLLFDWDRTFLQALIMGIILLIVFLLTLLLFYSFSLVESLSIKKSIKKSLILLKSWRAWLSLIILAGALIIYGIIVNIILKIIVKLSLGFIVFLLFGFILIMPTITFSRIYLSKLSSSFKINKDY